MDYLESFDKLQHDQFMLWLGNHIWEHEKASPGTPYKIPADLALLEQVFRGGWNVAAAFAEQARREAER